MNIKNVVKKTADKVLRNKISRGSFNAIFCNKKTIGIFNAIFENSPHVILEVLTRLYEKRNFDYEYKIKLKSGVEVVVPVKKDYIPSYELALSYKWHDPGLKNLEYELDNYYDNKLYYLDIGANHGLRSLNALASGRPVILFEPNIFLKEYVLELFKRNNFKNFKLENVCLSDHSDRSKFYISGSSYVSSLSKDHASSDELRDGIKEIDVSLISLDEYWDSNCSSEKIGFIKIDVEGHEYNVIYGAKNVLKKYEPSLMIEILPDSPNAQELNDILINIGYKCFAILNKRNLKISKIDSKEIFKPITGIDNYFYTTDDNLIKHLMHK